MSARDRADALPRPRKRRRRRKGPLIGRGQGRLLGWAAVGLVGVAGVCLVVYLVVFDAQGTPTRTADRFLTLLGRGKVEEARQHGSSALRARLTAGMLTLEARRLNLEGCTAPRWTDVRQGAGETILEGAVRTRGGDLLPVTLRLVREKGRWWVEEFDVPRPEPGGLPEEDPDG